MRYFDSSGGSFLHRLRYPQNKVKTKIRRILIVKDFEFFAFVLRVKVCA